VDKYTRHKNISDIKKSQKAFFDRKYIKWAWESYWSRFYKDRFNISDFEIAKMFNRLELRNSSSVLDIGCGDQPLTCIYAFNISCFSVGVDLSVRGLKRAKKNASRSNFSGSFHIVVADVNHLPFNSECFDAVIHSMVLEHVDNPEASLSEASRILKNGGKIFLYTVNRRYPFRKIYEMLLPGYFRAMGHSKNRYYSIYEIKSYFVKNGLQIEGEAYIFVFISAIFDLIILPKFSQLLIRKPWTQIYQKVFLRFLRVIAFLDNPLKKLGLSSCVIVIGRK
jgi:ubiquinone/menaquinone biosynthesis C-methylase UbiE